MAEQSGWVVMEGRLIAPGGEHYPLDDDWMGDRKPALKERLDALTAANAIAVEALREIARAVPSERDYFAQREIARAALDAIEEVTP